jgi:hypothetical protein
LPPQPVSAASDAAASSAPESMEAGRGMIFSPLVRAQHRPPVTTLHPRRRIE